MKRITGKRGIGKSFDGRTAVFLAIAVIVVAVLLLAALRMQNGSGYIYITELERPGRGQEKKSYELELVYDEGTRSMTVELDERELSAKELDLLYEQAEEELRSRLLGKNTGLECIFSPVELVSELPEYDMELEWYIEDLNIIDYWGDIYQSQEAQQVKVTATMIYGGRASDEACKSRSYEYELTVCGYTEEQLHENELRSLIAAADGDSAGEAVVPLPEEYEGRRIQYRIKRDDSYLKLLLLLPVVPALIIAKKHSDRTEKKKKLEEQLVQEYPEIISKLALLTGAGMTPYNALRRIASDGRGEAYRRLLVVIGNIQSGASEKSQYAAFGQIFGLHCYSRLGTLLEQNCVRGNQRLRLMLREECVQALEERKARARKAGEQAGTKMLLPMILMLIVVMAVIMIPSFMSL